MSYKQNSDASLDIKPKVSILKANKQLFRVRYRRVEVECGSNTGFLLTGRDMQANLLLKKERSFWFFTKSLNIH